MIAKTSYNIPLYRGRFVIMFADKSVKISEHYDDLNEGFVLDYAHLFKVNVKHKKRSTQGFLVAFNLNHSYRKITPGTISHEVFHATCAVLHDRGLLLTPDSEEAFSYLIDWMTDKVYDFMKHNNIKI